MGTTYRPKKRSRRRAARLSRDGVTTRLSGSFNFLAIRDVSVGTTAVELDSRNSTVRTREAAIGNLFADAMRASAKTDVGLTNGGNIRAGRVYAPGSSITRHDILAELPFNNRVVTVEINGQKLRRVIETGLRSLPDATGAFPQVSGLTIEADLARPAGNRVIAIKVGGSRSTRRRSIRSPLMISSPAVAMAMICCAMQIIFCLPAIHQWLQTR
jgi:5'-nucleotidase, C-terminal domain